MAFEAKNILQNFSVLGLSYSETPIAVRELFAMSMEAQKDLLADAKQHGIQNIVALSTCNRTELYIDTTDFSLVKKILEKHTKGTLDLIEKYGYYIKGESALYHLYEVGAGLDSQILGDFQIIGQLKNAYKQAEEVGTVDTLFNRMFSYVFQASKKIKNQTELSCGAASVAYAAVQYIRRNVADLDSAKLLLYGTGDIGKITCDNLLRHTSNRRLTLINRNERKAESLAGKYDVAYKKQQDLEDEIHNADVVIVATGATQATVTKSMLEETEHSRIFLDLSVPRNIAPEVKLIKNITLVGVDELSQESSEALSVREESIPLAKKLIEESKLDFYEWLEMHHLSPIFKKVKQGLEMLKQEEMNYHKDKLTEEEFAKVDFIASNIVNRIAKMGILHIKDVFKSEKGSADILAKMFAPQHGQDGAKMPPSHHHKIMHGQKCPHGKMPENISKKNN